MTDRAVLFRFYRKQERAAAARGVAWGITFDEWLKVWDDSGKLAQRGCRKGQYVMARYGDKGAYAVGNVFIQLHEENARDARLLNPRPWAWGGGLHNVGKGRGFKIKPHGFEVSVGKKYLGCFKTQAEAEAVYRAESQARRAQMLEQRRIEVEQHAGLKHPLFF